MNSPEGRKKLGEKLKKARQKAKLTQEQVADKSELSTGYYASVERGVENISSDNLLKLEKVLGIKLLNI